MTIETDIAERAHAEQLMAAFAVVLTHPAGFGIDFAATLRIDRVEDGRFRVYRLDDVAPEDFFDDVQSAVNFYLDLRDQLRLGLDYSENVNAQP